MSGQDQSPQLLSEELAALRARVTELEALEAGHRATEKRLRDTNQILEKIISTTHFCLVLLDTDFNFIWVNLAYARICGHPPNFFPGKNHFELFPHQGHRAVFRRVVETGQPYTVYARPFNFPSDMHQAPTYWDWTLHPVKDFEGRVEGLLLTLVDVTQAKTATNEAQRSIFAQVRAQAALNESEKKYQALVETTGTGFVVIDLAGRVLDANPEYVRLTGHKTLDDILHRRVTEWTAPHDLVRNREEIKKCLTQGQVRNLVIDYIDAAGRITPVEINATAVPTAEGYRIITLCRDVTERRQAEEALRASEAKFKAFYEEAKRAEEVYLSLLNSSADAIVIYDLEGRAKYVSPSFTQVFGYTPQEVLGQRIPFVPEDEKESSLAEIKRVIETGFPSRAFQTKRLTKDGRLLHISISASRYYDHQGQPEGILVTLRDITETKKLEDLLRQSQKMEAVGTLAGGIAHDFNNILQAISGYLQVILAQNDQDTKTRRYILEIEDMVERASDLIKRLLTFSRLRDRRMQPTDLNEIVLRTIKMVERTIPKMISVGTQLDQDLKLINGAPTELEQVLMNLATNARDAMPEGGSIFIETANISLDYHHSHEFNPLAPGEYVQLTFSDTGAGMDRETVARIFEPFFTTKAQDKGTGLGLAMVYGIVNGHGGHITCYSEPGHGTVFKIYIPALPTERNSLKKPYPIQEAILPGHETILLVDDEKTIIESVKEFLEEYGYSAMLAGSGEEALALAKDRTHDIDLVILDLNMPGMGGYNCLKELGQVRPDLPVIIASGYSASRQSGILLESGAKGFLSKPYKFTAMIKQVRQVLDNSSRI